MFEIMVVFHRMTSHSLKFDIKQNVQAKFKEISLIVDSSFIVEIA